MRVRMSFFRQPAVITSLLGIGGIAGVGELRKLDSFANPLTNVDETPEKKSVSTYISTALRNFEDTVFKCVPLNSVTALNESKKLVGRDLSKTSHLTHGQFDVCVIGGGIVGLATARQIAKTYPKLSICVCEAESCVGQHQTGHNSGVLHAGMYYVPGSVMADCCVNGCEMMYQYCEEKKLPVKRVGKLIVAANKKEHDAVETLFKRGNENGVKGLEIIYSDRIKELEPNVVGYSALYSPNTGICDFGQVAKSFARDVEENKQNVVYTDYKVNKCVPIYAQESKSRAASVDIYGTENGQYGPCKVLRAKHVITCAGLHSDTVSKLCGGANNPRVVAFRGRYYQTKPQFRNICAMNIYPVPTSGGIPVGVHFTPTVNVDRGEQMIIGPGACMAFSRHGYKFFDINLKDIWFNLTDIGCWKFCIKNPKLAVKEIYSDLNSKAFLRNAQKLVPSLTADMIEPSFSGVMAQCFESDGTAVGDFKFESNLCGGTTLSVRNAPSPACTASMAIGKHVVDVASKDFGWRQQ